MANSRLVTSISLLSLIGFFTLCSGESSNPYEFMKRALSKDRKRVYAELTQRSILNKPAGHFPAYTHHQDGHKEIDKIKSLPGQPNGVDFDQYSGYVTVDPHAGRALFYYFVEAPQDPSVKPLVLWLNGGPGCSSVGDGAMMELGPFRVNKDGKTLRRNRYAWNTVANIIFLESPAGVGFSYSNSTKDYKLNGDKRTAKDSYTFLVKWMERFPEYKNRDFFIAGESYAGHYASQLAEVILRHNKHSNSTEINLRGIAIGNPEIDFESFFRGRIDFWWTHALISDEIHAGIISHCNFTSLSTISIVCVENVQQAHKAIGNIYDYDLYSPVCNSSAVSTVISKFDPCTKSYVQTYLNDAQVQKSLHANITLLPHPWEACRGDVYIHWKDRASSVLPIIQKLMQSGISVWIYSGDTDIAVPVTSTKYSIAKLRTKLNTPWYPWYTQREVGGYAIGYENLTFVTIRGSGHFVPSYQPARALEMFSSFIFGKLPPAA